MSSLCGRWGNSGTCLPDSEAFNLSTLSWHYLIKIPSGLLKYRNEPCACQDNLEGPIGFAVGSEFFGWAGGNYISATKYYSARLPRSLPWSKRANA